MEFTKPDGIPIGTSIDFTESDGIAIWWNLPNRMVYPKNIDDKDLS